MDELESGVSNTRRHSAGHIAEQIGPPHRIGKPSHLRENPVIGLGSMEEPLVMAAHAEHAIRAGEFGDLLVVGVQQRRKAWSQGCVRTSPGLARVIRNEVAAIDNDRSGDEPFIGRLRSSGSAVASMRSSTIETKV
jgi:hypothetical protein